CELITRIKAVKSYGVRNGMRVYAGYNAERKVRGRKQKAAARGAVYYAEDHPYTDEIHRLPREFTDRICCGDAETLLKGIPSNSIDLVFTSPPYNFGLGYDTSPDGVDWGKYFERLFGVLDECIRVLKFGGRLVVNIQPLFSDYIPSHHLISAHCMKQKMIWRGEILWEKHNYNCKYTAWGSWKSPSSPYLKYTWEFLEVFSKGDLKKPGRKEDADITAGEFKEWVVARWPIAPERHMQMYGHPAMFPPELAVRVLKLFSFRGDIILDPFNGTGTTCVAAKRTGRHYLGIDISPAYCSVAEERLSKSGTDEGESSQRHPL
ncbi:MAG: site-specific DNA-methyltransferase, partial [Methanoregulaceae archaeon]|nr:site-specific DNA-methyltransferase [Methanoregulaceae archaeon]